MRLQNVVLSIAAKIHGSLWKDIQAIHFPERSTNNIKNQYVGSLSGCRRVVRGLKLSNRYTILSRKGFQAPSTSASCCAKRTKRRAADCNDYEQGHVTEELIEQSELIQSGTGEELAHTSNSDHMLGSGSLVDGTGYDSFLHDFQMHDNTFATGNQTFQSPPASQINDFHFQAPAGDFAQLEPFHDVPAGNSFGSNQKTLVNSVASNRHSGGFPYITQQRSKPAREPLPEPPANEISSTPKSSSSSGYATVCPDDDMSDSDDVTTEPPVLSDQPRSKQRRRITITLEHADPETLASFLNAALQSEAKISFETNNFGT
ncbi:MAG: hypothetical protein Q9184_005395 [Pyrenodesmia sp. 2 TL-2023]